MRSNLKKMISGMLAIVLALESMSVSAADYMTDGSLFEAEPVEAMEPEYDFTDSAEESESVSQGGEIIDFSDDGTEEISFDSGEIKAIDVSSGVEEEICINTEDFFNNHKYVLYDQSITWTEAKEYCERLGGHLVTITSQEEQKFIERLMENGEKKQYWIGAFLEGNVCRWVTEEELIYTNWDVNEPNRSMQSGIQEQYIQIYNSGGNRFSWNDMFDDNTVQGVEHFFCLNNVGFICEFDSETMLVSSVSSDALVAEYSDDYFLTSAVNESNNLAQLSIVASDAAYKDTTAFLESCGFLNIVDKYIDKNYLTQKTPMLHPIKVTFGYKTISSGEKKYDLYAIIVRGTTGALEWASNFDLDSLNRECADQFMIPKDNIKILFDSYKETYSTSGATTKIWVTGHSRGGAVANLLAHDLSGKYSASNVYAYTFACARVVTKKLDDANIFNYIIQEDVVPKVPPGYVRYGKDIVLNTKGHMDKLYQQMTSKKYEGTVAQAHSLEAYMCAFLNTITFPEEDTRISMNITSKDLYPGEEILLEATVSGVSSKVKWKSSDKKVATVSSSGNVTAKKVGTATITAYVTGKDKEIKEATCSITVKENSITLNRSNATIYISGTNTVELVATVSGASSKVKWTSSNKAIATVSSKGVVTAKKVGTATITAMANGVNAFCEITVYKSAQKSLVKLKDNKTYLSYDFTRDGKGDKFWYTYHKGESIDSRIYNIYVNDKMALSVSTFRGMQFYFYQLSNKKTYLIVSNHYAGGANSLTFYYYKSGKFVEIGENKFTSGFSFYSDYVSKAQKDLLYVKSSLKFWNQYFSKSLQGIGQFGIELEVPYKVSDSKIQRASKYMKCLGNRRFQALDSFYTSKSITNLSKKDGPRISANKIVMLEQICWISDTKKVFLISLDGKRGWFLDSSNAKIKWIP